MLPLLCIQILLTLLAPVAAGAPDVPSNISANGLPNCSKSSDAFEAEAAADCAGAAPNKSTIGAPAEDAGGDDRNGFVSAAPAPPLLVGEETFDLKMERKKIY